MRPRAVILAADELPIEEVLFKLFNIYVPLGVEGWRCDCPLSYEHSNPSVKSMKVYSASNSAWCFSHSKKFTPVTLHQLNTNKNRLETAYDLLSKFGVSFTPPTLEERWAAEPPQDTIDRVALQETFANFLQTLPDYATRQYDPDVLDKVNNMQSSVAVLPDDSDYATIERWMTFVKTTMRDFWRDRYGS